jgi:GDSL-like lipase/acylhydrolase family protein
MTRLSAGRWAGRLALLLASTCLSLAAAELALRLWGPRGLGPDSRTLEQKLADSEASVPQEGPTVSLRGLVQASADPRQIYELKPGLHARFQGVSLDINSDGFRDRSHPRVKPSGVRRLIGLGDSVLFGWGVEEPECFLRRLEQTLNASGRSPGWEVLNLGVPGYNTMQEAELLESVGLLYAPDVVLLCFVPNDDQLPNFVQREDGTLLESSVLYKLLLRGARAIGEARRPTKDQVWSDPQLVPPEYVSMVGPEAVRQGLLRIGYLAGAHKFMVKVFCFRGYRGLSSQVRAWCGEFGLDYLDLDAWLDRHGLHYGPDLQLSLRDFHPNARFHEAIAEFLGESLASAQ